MNKVLHKKKLIELVDVFNNQRIPLSAKERESLSKIYPYYGAQSIVDYVDNYLFDGEYILLAEDGENLRSNNQNICNLVNGKFWVNNHAHILKANADNITKYLFYNFNRIRLEPYITGSAQPKLNKENLLNIVTYVHDRKEQQKIASVLSALDSKIELNNRINAELESMVKTIYDYWFVQFDFPDKNGKPYKTSGGKMVWNEELKREIPEGWEVNRFGEVVIIKNGKDHKHLKSGSFPVYGSGGVMRYVNEYLYDSESILIPRKGSLGNLFYLNQPFWSVDTIFYTQMKFAHSCKYLFYTTQNFNISKMNTGTAVPSMTAGILNNLSLVFPSEDILKRFDDILNPIFKNKDVLIKESEELTSLRDWLLPMLMNGQVRVS